MEIKSTFIFEKQGEGGGMGGGGWGQKPAVAGDQAHGPWLELPLELTSDLTV